MDGLTAARLSDSLMLKSQAELPISPAVRDCLQDIGPLSLTPSPPTPTLRARAMKQLCLNYALYPDKDTAGPEEKALQLPPVLSLFDMISLLGSQTFDVPVFQLK